MEEAFSKKGGKGGKRGAFTSQQLNISAGSSHILPKLRTTTDQLILLSHSSL